MKLNKKKLNVILPQIKAHLNVAVMTDNPKTPGSVDFFFQPAAKGTEPGYLNKLTCSMGEEDGLFESDAIETLGSPLTVNIARLRDALKVGDSDPEFKDGAVNGISVLVNSDDYKFSGMCKIIKSGWKSIKKYKPQESVKFTMSRVDYELMADTVTPFVSQDPIRYLMNGYYVDFGKSDDFINFAATDGQRLSVCKFPCTRTMPGDKEDDGFILKPLNLFIPKSAYSKTLWTVNEFFSLIQIQTEDYSIDCWAKPIEGTFPNYPKVIPDKRENPEWMSLSVRSARNAFGSIKGLIDNSGYSLTRNAVFFNAEDPKRIRLTVPGASADIDGEASRPMRIRASWDLMSSGFFETPYTKFMIQNANKAILIEEPRAVPGTTMSIVKVIMPLQREDNADEWGLADLTKTRSDRDKEEPEDEAEDEFEDEDEIEYGDSGKGSGEDSDEWDEDD
jgi:DNA polymerase III sliding clamp (beta) subunit (PCNA family)